MGNDAMAMAMAMAMAIEGEVEDAHDRVDDVFGT